MVTFDFIRHAKTPWNLDKKLQGKSDIALARQGIEQAHAWGQILHKRKYDCILSSPMIRAKQTSQIIAQYNKAQIQYDHGLREQDFGQWEGKKIADLRVESPGEIEAEESRGWAFCPPGGESRHQVLQRVDNTLKTIGKQNTGAHFLVVCHSSVIKTLIYKALNRKFVPGEPKILKAYHLHEMVWDNTLKIKKLNSINLM